MYSPLHHSFSDPRSFLRTVQPTGQRLPSRADGPDGADSRPWYVASLPRKKEGLTCAISDDEPMRLRFSPSLPRSAVKGGPPPAEQDTRRVRTLGVPLGQYSGALFR